MEIMTCLDYIDDSGSIDHGVPINFGGSK